MLGNGNQGTRGENPHSQKAAFGEGRSFSHRVAAAFGAPRRGNGLRIALAVRLFFGCLDCQAYAPDRFRVSGLLSPLVPFGLSRSKDRDSHPYYST
jgi:hypothetical protein